MRTIHVYDDRWPAAGFHETHRWPSYESNVSSPAALQASIIRVFSLSEGFDLFLKTGQSWSPLCAINSLPAEPVLWVAIRRRCNFGSTADRQKGL